MTKNKPNDIKSCFQDTKKYLQGFTLMEALVYVAVLAIVISAMIAFVFWVIKFNAKVRAANETQKAARQALEIITYELKEAESIYTPTSIFNIHPGQLSIETTSDLPPGETKTYKDFYLDDGKLYLKKEGSIAELITTENVRVSNFILRRLAPTAGPESVEIDLAVQYYNPASKPELHAETRLISAVSLRAY